MSALRSIASALYPPAADPGMASTERPSSPENSGTLANSE